MASIYQSSKVTQNADIAVNNPFAPYVYKNTGDPLAAGNLYFGLPGRSGKVLSNRKNVYAVTEEGNTVTLDQPIVLSQGGVPQVNGEPVLLAVDGSYSLLVEDKDGVKQYYAPKIVAKSLLGYSGIIPEESKTIANGNLTVTFNVIEATTASFYASTSTTGSEFKGEYLQKDIDYDVVSNTTITLKGTYPNGTVILARALDPTGQTVPVTANVKPLFIYDNHADAITADLDIGDSALINGKDVIADGKGGSYIVVAGGTGSNDGYNFINLNNGNQLKIKSVYQVFQYYSEKLGNASINASELIIDPSDGNIAHITLTASITKITVSNVPPSGELKVQLKVIQDATGNHAITWSINNVTAKAPGGALPTVTVTAGAVDEYIIRTDDGGANWYLNTIGQDIK